MYIPNASCHTLQPVRLTSKSGKAQSSVAASQSTSFNHWAVIHFVRRGYIVYHAEDDNGSQYQNTIVHCGGGDGRCRGPEAEVIGAKGLGVGWIEEGHSEI